MHHNELHQSNDQLLLIRYPYKFTSKFQDGIQLQQAKAYDTDVPTLRGSVKNIVIIAQLKYQLRRHLI